MTRHRFSFRLVAWAGLLLAGACASLSDAGGGTTGPCVGPQCEPVDAGTDKKTPDTSVSDAPTDGEPPKTNPLCGVPDAACSVEHQSSCSGSGDGGLATDAGAFEAGSDAAGGRVSDGGPQFSPPGTGSEAGPPPAPGMGCYVTLGSGDEPTPQCLPAGSGTMGSPCTSSSDCSAGFACVGNQNAAQCRPYCCGDPEACPDGTFCAERAQRDDELLVPVCVKADNCSLAEPYPCPSGASCTCAGDTACMVVRDKTTSCVVPGTGTEGESCPCAWGHLCSKSNDKCGKLCPTSSSSPDCGSKKCTPVPYLPDGWGVCV